MGAEPQRYSPGSALRGRKMDTRWRLRRVLTADHCVAPVPEVNEARKMPGGRLSGPKLRQKMLDALTKRFGPGEWILPGAMTTPYLNLDLVRARMLEPAAVERVAADAASG